MKELQLYDVLFLPLVTGLMGPQTGGVSCADTDLPPTGYLNFQASAAHSAQRALDQPPPSLGTSKDRKAS